MVACLVTKDAGNVFHPSRGKRSASSGPKTGFWILCSFRGGHGSLKARGGCKVKTITREIRRRGEELRRVIWLLLVVVFVLNVDSVPMFGQEASHQAHQGGPVPREILERPVPLRSGIGTVHEKVSTSSSEAQAFYDQGLAYLHSFVWIEAVRSFHQALRLDPNLAMAYLGLTDAFIGLHDVPTARATCERAKTLEKGMSERERTWLSIRESELEFLEDNENPNGYAAYRKSINDALKANPN